jgi:hypothetical protein
VRVAGREAEDGVDVQSRVHARDDCQLLARRQRQVAVFEGGGVGLVVAQQLVDDGHGTQIT